HPDERVVRQTIATIQASRVNQFDESLLALATDSKRPADLRVAAVTAAAPRVAKGEPALFDFFLVRLDKDMPALARLAAASCLGNLRLDDSQLDMLSAVVAMTGSLELPQLAAAYDRSKSPAVGMKLVAALDKSPGLQSLSSEGLTRMLQGYPEE